MTEGPTAPATTEDALLDGRVRLIQPAKGFRAAIDSVLLAAAVPARAGESVLDVGAGVGAAALCLAARVPDCRIFGIEIARDLVRLAGENARLNGWDRRITIMTGDLTSPPPRLAAGSFQHVMANPPYLAPERADASPVAARAAAAVEGRGRLADWIGFCLAMLAPRGSVTVIHRADRLAELLALLDARAGGIVVLPLWPGRDGTRPAKRVIVQARKGSSAPLRLLPGLALHEAGGGYTDEAEAVLRHGAALAL